MNSTMEKKSEKSAEAADSRLNWRYQNKEYNESFKEWRKQKQNSIGFYYEENPNQLTYQDKVGFIHDYPEAHESRAFQRAITILALILLYRALCDGFSTYFLPSILNLMGVDIYSTFFSGQRYGDETTLLTFDLLAQVIGRVLPIAVLARHLQMPVSVMFPTKITNKPMFRFSIPAILLVTAVCSLLMFFYEDLLSIGGIISERSLLIPTGTENIIYFAVSQILIIPIVSEFCTHGVMLQFTRQFGEGTSLIITSIIMTFTAYDITMLPFNFITSLVIGYFTIRTGSVITSAVMRVVQRAFVYTLYFLDYRVDAAYSDTLVGAFFFLTLVIGLAFTVHFMCNYSDRFNISLKERYMSVSAKVLCAASNVPLIIWFTLTFVMTILNLDFRL